MRSKIVHSPSCLRLVHQCLDSFLKMIQLTLILKHLYYMLLFLLSTITLS